MQQSKHMCVPVARCVFVFHICVTVAAVSVWPGTRQDMMQVKLLGEDEVKYCRNCSCIQQAVEVKKDSVTRRHPHGVADCLCGI